MRFLAVFIFFMVLGFQPAFAATKKMGIEKEQYPRVEWDLSGLFKNKKEWTTAQTRVKKNFEPLKKCEGRLGKSANRLQTCLDNMFATRLQLSRIYSWASLQRSADSLSAETTEMTSQVSDLWSQFSQATSFFAPEIAQVGEKKISKFQRSNKELSRYSQYLRNIFVQAKHILSSKEEAVISAFRPVTGSSSGTFNLLQSADIEWPTVQLSTGETEINIAGYTKHRQSANREDRKKAFDAFYGVLKKYERTFGSTLTQSVKSRTIEAKLRGHENALSQALSSRQLPEEIYRTLVKEVNKSLPTLHRYLKLRQQILGVKDQKYYDIYPSVVDTTTEYSLEKTRQMSVESSAPLGKEYVSQLAEVTQKQWMDVYPRKGKSSGAFMSGSVYDLHPFVFLNHQNDYNSASTYAHEGGHAMHTLLSNKEQPYAKARYSIFIAEIAAIVNETLMLEKAIKDAKDDQEKLYYLGYALESIRGTYFRQTQFSEFELKLHELVEKGEALSGQKISKIYGDIVRKYYGQKEGVLEVDDKFTTEWAFVPHFYYGFYVYQYSTSISAAHYFAEKILAGDQETLDKYLTVLKAGGSKYPHEILLDAGLDMTKPYAYRAIDRKANAIMDQMEGLLENGSLRRPASLN